MILCLFDILILEANLMINLFWISDDESLTNFVTVGVAIAVLCSGLAIGILVFVCIRKQNNKKQEAQELEKTEGQRSSELSEGGNYDSLQYEGELPTNNENTDGNGRQLGTQNSIELFQYYYEDHWEQLDAHLPNF